MTRRDPLLYQRQMTEKRVMSEANADLVTHALRGHQRWYRRGANIGKPAAGKTGTAQENRASWFAGCVPRLTAVVWMAIRRRAGTTPAPRRSRACSGR